MVNATEGGIMGVGFSGGVGAGFYNTAGGSLPWGQPAVSAFAGMSGSNPMAGLAQSYGQSYNAALQQNKSNYNNILAGYQSALGSQQRAQADLSSGYGQLYDSVLGKIDGIGNARADEINKSYAADLAKNSQSLIDRGLGNTTVQTAVASGNAKDKAAALSNNAESMAGLNAGYMSQLGLAGLNARQQSYMANTGLLGRQFDWMNSVSAKYPDAGMYANLASQYGGQRGGGSGGALPGSGPVSGLGYAMRPAPSYYDGGTPPSVGSVGSGSNMFSAPGGGGSWNTLSDAYSKSYAPAAPDYGGGGDFGNAGAYDYGSIGAPDMGGMMPWE